MKKALMVVAFNGYQEHEYNETRRVLEENEVVVEVASLQEGEATSHMGNKTKVDLSVGEVNIDNYDAVVFIGGEGMVDLVDNEQFMTLARKFYEAEKITAAICIAPMILANTGLLANKKATVWEGVKNKLTAEGANYTGESVTVDDKLITGNGPKAATQFGAAVTKNICL